MTVKHTYNLEQFTINPEMNRKISSSWVNQLSKRIAKKGLKRPIEVSRKGEILDGQHRYLAIKKLHTEGRRIKLKYMQTTMKPEDVAEINGYTRKWTHPDWINYYVQRGNQDYILLTEALDRYKPMGLSGLFPFLTSGTLATSCLKAGTFKYECSADDEYIIENLIRLSKFNSVYNMKQVTLAIKWLTRQENFDPKRLFHVLSRNLDSIEIQSGTSNWAHHLLYWYNKGLHRAKLDKHDIPRHH